MNEVLLYEIFFLSAASFTLLYTSLKNKENKELLYFSVGIIVITLTKVYIFIGRSELLPLTYILTTCGYFLSALGVLKLTSRLKSIKVLEHAAFYDPLTKAYSRHFIEELLNEELRKANRLKGEFCILLVDLNDFKQVNDRYGHIVGDLVLKKTFEELRKRFREYDMIARWGGDEFLVLLPAERQSNILDVVNRLISEFRLKYKDVEISLSVGYACYPYDGNNLVKLIEVADRRMYISKNALKEVRRHAVDDKGEEEV